MAKRRPSLKSTVEEQASACRALATKLRSRLDEKWLVPGERARVGVWATELDAIAVALTAASSLGAFDRLRAYSLGATKVVVELGLATAIMTGAAEGTTSVALQNALTDDRGAVECATNIIRHNETIIIHADTNLSQSLSVKDRNPSGGPRVDDPLAVEFGRALKEFREDTGMTQQDLASMTGYSRARISQFERGRGRPTAGAIPEFYAAFRGAEYSDRVVAALREIEEDGE